MIMNLKVLPRHNIFSSYWPSPNLRNLEVNMSLYNAFLLDVFIEYLYFQPMSILEIVNLENITCAHLLLKGEITLNWKFWSLYWPDNENLSYSVFCQLLLCVLFHLNHLRIKNYLPTFGRRDQSSEHPSNLTKATQLNMLRN